ncbi:DEAD/DEAH box helicase [Aureispira anguillae]|uniref:DEAD/DEAH box helicase n=1 Tax=Aureispira anguillae TaxID=2864201 RepID=A0A916DWT2_9BACT|nr:DEAD/DEAH box helicase [Aureispira anguillae]BDS15162.1 DEAD/DEAH box helicase [Aureispira anguillae]
MISKIKDLRTTYQSLNSPQKDLVKILTLIDNPEDKTKILQICAKAKLKANNKQTYNVISLGQALESLRQLHLVKKNLDQKYQIHPDVYHFTIQQVIADKRLTALRKGVTDIYPGLKTPYQAHRYPKQLTRDASFALYNNDYSTFQLAVKTLQKDSSFYLDALYKKLFIERLGIENISKLSPEFQFEFYKSQLGEMIIALKDVNEPLNNIQQIGTSLQRKDLDLINYHVSIHALLKGDWQTIRKLWDGKDSIDALKFKGWLYFAQGYNIKALNRYEKALKDYRKKEKSLKAYFSDYHGVIFILALLKDHNTKHIPEIKTYFKEVFAHTISNVYLYLGSIVDHLQQNPNRAQELFEQEHLYYNLHGLLYLYAQYWTQCFAPNWESYALTLQHKSIKNGYYWVAYNVAVLMQEISTNRKDFYATKTEELQEIIGHIPSLLDVIGIQEEWEVALQALEALHSHNINTQNNQQSRLIWLVDFEQDIIQPKIQRVNKNGSWSKGRNANLDKLTEGAILEATPHDLRVINTISKASGFYNNNGYGFYSPAKTFQALIDHPLLFLYKSPEVACELRQGLVELVVKETKDGYSISPSIDIKHEGCYIIKETPTRYQLIQVSEKQVQLAQAIGAKSLNVPFKGKAQLERTLAGLSTIMPLQSDLEFQNDEIPFVESDSRLYVHLLPVGEGFDIEFFVKPFQVSAPYFKPGKGSARVVAKIEAIRTQTKRNLEEELQSLNHLINSCSILRDSFPENDLWQLESPHTCLKLLHELEPFKIANLIVIEWPKGEQLKIKQQISFDNLKLSIQKDNDWFGISGKIQVNENLVLDMRQLLNMMQEQQSEFIELDDGQFLALSEDLQQRLDSIYKFTDDDGRIHPLASFAFEGLTEDIQDISIDEEWENHINALKTIDPKAFEVPNNLNATLRSYQKEGFQWLSKLAAWGVGACLADDMGLGKTIQALTVILERSSKGPSLVVAPASVCRNWTKEIDKFAPSLTPILFSESDRKQSIAEAQAGHVLITTYGLLQTESDLFASKVFETIVLDEAQAIKNSNAKRSQAAMKLNGNFKIITTGTPIENHLGELWNLFRFINPGLLGSLKNFRDRFAIPIEKDKNIETQQQLQLLIRPFILRRHKKEVLKELPEKTEIVLSVNLSEEEQVFYEALRRNAVESLEKEAGEQAGTKHLKVLAQIMRLRRACCNPQLVDPSSMLKSSKLRLFGEIVSELIANGHKALVFSQFVGHLQLIEEYIKSQNISYQYLDGQTPTKKRQERIDAFQNGEGELFLISLKAGGTGLNLTAADYVLHMDPWWNPAVEDQASDRAHRIGQKRPVTVYRLITENTIEEKIIKLHENKRDLADSLLEGTDASSKLSAEDLLNLIKNN